MAKKAKSNKMSAYSSGPLKQGLKTGAEMKGGKKPEAKVIKAKKC